MFVILAAFLLIFLGLVATWYVQYYKYSKYLAKYSGPTPLPIVGNALEFSSVADFLPVVRKMQKEHGNVFKIMLGFRPRLVIAEEKHAEFILGSNTILEKSYEYYYFHSWLGLGLLTSSNERWRRQRKLITPTFHFQILEQFIDIFNKHGITLIEKLHQEVDKKEFDVFPYVKMYALDAICEAAMGTFVNAQHSNHSEYVHSAKEMCRILMERAFSAVKMWDFLYPFTNDYTIEKKALQVLHGYSNSVIKKRKQECLENKTETDSNDDSGIKKRLAFLDLLLQARVDGNPLPDEVIREEVDTFMFEGHDTTASGISFTLYSLAKYPEIQGKVVDELRTIFGDDKTRHPTYKDLQEMKYLDLVIKESMRLFPPVPIIARILEEDVTFDDVVLPKGLAISIFPFGLHRNGEAFPDPEKFDPERFSPENTQGRSPYAYVPFSAGPRNCIGQRFAQLEMKAAVSKVLRNFELFATPGHEPVLAAEAVLKSENGLLLKIKERNF